MSGARYSRGGMYAADMTVYMREIAETNDEMLGGLKQRLIMALRQEVSPRQRQMMTMYYVQHLNMREIGDMLGVDRSTVSRTIRRGEAVLRRCLRFGAAELLDQVGVVTEHNAVRSLAKREGYENVDHH